MSTCSKLTRTTTVERPGVAGLSARAASAPVHAKIGITWAMVMACTWVMVMACFALVAVPGCKKGDSKSKAGIAALGGKKDMGIIPKDADAVGGVDVAKVVASSLWKNYGSWVMMAVASEFQQFKQACAMDPLTTIESIVAAGTVEREDGIVVVKGAARQDAINCAKKLAESQGEQLTVSDDGNLTRAVDSKGVTTYVGWLDDKTLVFSPEAGLDQGKMSGLMSGQSGFDSNKEMMDLLGKVDTSAALWGVVKNSQGRSIGPLSGTAAYGHVRLDGGGIQIDAGLRQDSADKARTVADELEGTLRSFKGSGLDKLVSKVHIETKDSDVLVDLSLDQDELQEVIEAVMANADLMQLVERLRP